MENGPRHLPRRAASTARPSPTPSGRPAPWSSRTRWLHTWRSRRPRTPPLVGRHLAERAVRRVHGLPGPSPKATCFTDTWPTLGAARKACYDADQRLHSTPSPPKPPRGTALCPPSTFRQEPPTPCARSAPLRQLRTPGSARATSSPGSASTSSATRPRHTATLADFITTRWPPAPPPTATSTPAADAWLRATGSICLLPGCRHRAPPATLPSIPAGQQRYRAAAVLVRLTATAARPRLRPARAPRTSTRHAGPHLPRPPPRPDRPQRPGPHLRQDPPRPRLREAAPARPLRHPRPASPAPCCEHAARRWSRRPAGARRLPGDRRRPTSPRRATSPVRGRPHLRPHPGRRPPTHPRGAARRPHPLTTLCEDLLRRTEDGSSPGLRLTAVRHPHRRQPSTPTSSAAGMTPAPSPAAPSSTPSCAGASSAG